MVVERVEKSEIFPPLPQPDYGGGNEGKRRVIPSKVLRMLHSEDSTRIGKRRTDSI